jgi:hypothetical protein
MKSQGALVYWFDLAPEMIDEWVEWYIRDHMPSRVGATFSAAHCYRAVGSKPAFLAHYEAETAEALLAPGYLALLRKPSTDDRLRRGWYLNTVRATCRVCASLGHGQGGVAATIRVSPPAASRLQIRERLVDDVAPFLAQTKRVGAVQILEADNEIRTKMDEARVTGQADGSADWVIRVDAAREEDIAGAIARLNEFRAWKELGLMDTAILGSYRLLYSISSN